MRRGGDNSNRQSSHAGFAVSRSVPADFLKTREQYIAWGNEDADRGDRASRFLNKPRIASTDVPSVGAPK